MDKLNFLLFLVLTGCLMKNEKEPASLNSILGKYRYVENSNSSRNSILEITKDSVILSNAFPDTILSSKDSGEIHYSIISFENNHLRYYKSDYPKYFGSFIFKVSGESLYVNNGIEYLNLGNEGLFGFYQNDAIDSSLYVGGKEVKNITNLDIAKELFYIRYHWFFSKPTDSIKVNISGNMISYDDPRYPSNIRYKYYLTSERLVLEEQFRTRVYVKLSK